MIRSLAIIIAVLIAGSAGPGRAQSARPEPYVLIRALQLMQDDIARGSKSAHADQGKLLSQIGIEFGRHAPSLWKDEKNVQAAAQFLFSGGSPAPIRALLLSGAVEGPRAQMVRGALAFAEGRDGDAISLLLRIDPRSLHPSVGGSLALAQSALLAPREPAKALALLDLARLLMPGTLVEETAIRRELVLAQGAGLRDKTLFLAGQYLRRFGQSVYAEEFRPRIVDMAVTMAKNADETAFQKIVSMLTAFRPDETRAAYVQIARAALMDGKLAIAELAADVLRSMGGADTERARLYAAAAGLAGERYDSIVSDIEALKAASLDADDRALLAAMKVVANEIRAWPDPHTVPEPPRSGQVMPDARDKLLRSARNAMREVDLTLLRDLR